MHYKEAHIGQCLGSDWTDSDGTIDSNSFRTITLIIPFTHTFHTLLMEDRRWPVPR